MIPKMAFKFRAANGDVSKLVLFNCEWINSNGRQVLQGFQKVRNHIVKRSILKEEIVPEKSAFQKQYDKTHRDNTCREAVQTHKLEKALAKAHATLRKFNREILAAEEETIGQDRKRVWHLKRIRELGDFMHGMVLDAEELLRNEPPKPPAHG